MACLDTSFIIDILRGKDEVAKLKEELDKTESTLSIATPAIMELWSGACLAKVTQREKEKINELLESMKILRLDEEAAKTAGEIEFDLLSKGITIETEDIMIAAIAQKNGEKIVTKDAHYTKIPNLRVLKY